MEEQEVEIGRLSRRTGVPPSIIRDHHDGRIPFRKVESTRKGKQAKIHYPVPEAEERLRLCRTLWDMGFEKEEQLAIVRKVYEDRVLSLQSLREKIRQIPFPEFLRFLRDKGVVLLQREYLTALLTESEAP